eukprot:TRINITY_DN19268_c0_g1_i1.p1 TRINITY_DN19268_c0_g1~~TRINITY_DN19268_c0_g1_i1.p1  ORF type:complete len:774 (+),score=198.29 TRINITY_DN19268_c0_g1_i1:75-2324(+)
MVRADSAAAAAVEAVPAARSGQCGGARAPHMDPVAAKWARWRADEAECTELSSRLWQEGREFSSRDALDLLQAQQHRDILLFGSIKNAAAQRARFYEYRAELQRVEAQRRAVRSEAEGYARRLIRESALADRGRATPCQLWAERSARREEWREHAAQCAGRLIAARYYQGRQALAEAARSDRHNKLGVHKRGKAGARQWERLHSKQQSVRSTVCFLERWAWDALLHSSAHRLGEMMGRLRAMREEGSGRRVLWELHSAGVAEWGARTTGAGAEAASRRAVCELRRTVLSEAAQRLVLAEEEQQGRRAVAACRTTGERATALGHQEHASRAALAAGWAAALASAARLSELQVAERRARRSTDSTSEFLSRAAAAEALQRAALQARSVLATAEAAARAVLCCTGMLQVRQSRRRGVIAMGERMELIDLVGTSGIGALAAADRPENRSEYRARVAESLLRQLPSDERIARVSVVREEAVVWRSLPFMQGPRSPTATREWLLQRHLAGPPCGTAAGADEYPPTAASTARFCLSRPLGRLSRPAAAARGGSPPPASAASRPPVSRPPIAAGALPSPPTAPQRLPGAPPAARGSPPTPPAASSSAPSPLQAPHSLPPLRTPAHDATAAPFPSPLPLQQPQQRARACGVPRPRSAPAAQKQPLRLVLAPHAAAAGSDGRLPALVVRRGSAPVRPATGGPRRASRPGAAPQRCSSAGSRRSAPRSLPLCGSTGSSSISGSPASGALRRPRSASAASR